MYISLWMDQTDNVGPFVPSSDDLPASELGTSATTVPLPDHSVDGDGTSLILFNENPENEEN
jgi:hypothetical protein